MLILSVSFFNVATGNFDIVREVHIIFLLESAHLGLSMHTRRLEQEYTL